MNFQNLYFLLLLLILPKLATSQVFTFEEAMRESSCPDLPCFQEFITSKGFFFRETQSNEFGVVHSFCSDTLSTTIKGFPMVNTAAIGFGSKGGVSISIGTADKAYLKRLKKELRANKFKRYQSAYTFGNTQFMTWYQSASHPNLQVTLAEATTTEGGASWKKYYLVIKKQY